jgi:hypothetical protein
MTGEAKPLAKVLNNACLVAAAPTMFDALKAFGNVMEQTRRYDEDALSTAYSLAVAALTDAEKGRNTVGVRRASDSAIALT